MQLMNRKRFLAASGVALAAATAPSAFARTLKTTRRASVPTVTYGTDAGLGPYLSPWFKAFNSEYSNAHGSLALFGSYYPDVEARLAAGGKGIDVVFSDPGYAETWYKNGWIRPLDGLPGLAELNADVLPVDLRKDLYATDGKQISIPYYNALRLFAYNEQLLHKVSKTVPTSWDEVTTLLGQLKSAGVESPYCAFWNKDFNTIVYTFLAHCASDGMTDAFDSSPHNLPILDKSSVAHEVMNRWISWYKNGYVSGDIVSSSYTTISGLFAAGKSAFTDYSGQEIKPWQTTKSNASYGQTKIALMPGKTQGTLTDTSTYHITTASQNVPEAWELAKFLSWRDPKKASQYTVPIGYLLDDFGLTAPYKGLLGGRAVAKSLSFLDLSIYKQQSSKATNLLYPADRQPWFSGWMTTMASALQSAIIGQTSVDGAFAQGSSYAKAHLA
jgi:ABC-type glycerol-3-phosphate transport system substrate-binding protein